jgi:hypothetical protein
MPIDSKIKELNDCSSTDIDTENECCSDEIFKNLKKELSNEAVLHEITAGHTKLFENTMNDASIKQQADDQKDNQEGNQADDQKDDQKDNQEGNQADDQKDDQADKLEEENCDEKTSFFRSFKTIDISRKIFHFVNYMVFINWFLYFIDFNVDCLFVEKLLFLFFMLKSSSYIYEEYVKVYLDKLFNFYFAVNIE